MLRVALICMAMACCSAQLGGCTSAAIAAAGATAGFGLAQGQAEAFLNGELKAARMVTMPTAEHATIEAFNNVQIPVRIHNQRTREIYMMGQAEGGPDIRVTLSYISPIATKVEIRVGMFGDLAISRFTLARIDAMLGIEQPLVPVEASPIVAPPPKPSKADDAPSESKESESKAPSEPPP